MSHRRGYQGILVTSFLGTDHSQVWSGGHRKFGRWPPARGFRPSIKREC